MRNSKVKGFTLIELIVVIAIIGILAAILVPSMLGYVRNARISSANSGAKQVHTAVSSALTQLGISNWDFSSSHDATNDAWLKFSGGTSTLDWSDDVGNPPSAAAMDLGAYLGDEFKDNGIAIFNKSTYSVYYAGYASTSAGWTKVGSLESYDDMEAVTESIQKADAKAGNIYGIYPAPKVGS